MLESGYNLQAKTRGFECFKLFYIWKVIPPDNHGLSKLFEIRAAHTAEAVFDGIAIEREVKLSVWPFSVDRILLWSGRRRRLVEACSVGKMCMQCGTRLDCCIEKKSCHATFGVLVYPYSPVLLVDSLVVFLQLKPPEVFLRFSPQLSVNVIWFKNALSSSHAPLQSSQNVPLVYRYLRRS